LINPDNRFRKTAKGVEEIGTRQHKLAPRLRSVLVLVFSSRHTADLRDQARAIGAPEGCLEQLVEGGFIEPASGEEESPTSAQSTASAMPPTAMAASDIANIGVADRFIAAHRFMDTTVTDAGGLKSYFFQLKLSRCGNMDDLINILPEYEKFMTKQVGEVGAKVYVAELKTLLG
jgi:hypothetical protein